MILFPYIIALHTSIAMMELFGWLAAVGGLGYAVLRKRKELFQFVSKYRRVCIALLSLTAWVAISLLASPLEKPFLFQWGFMRWALLLFGLTQALTLFWTPAHERKWVWIWGFCLAVTSLYAGLQFFTGIDFIRPDRNLVNPQGGGVFKAVGFFSMSLTFAYVFGQSLFAISRRGHPLWGKFGSVALILLGSVGLVASMSRGAWVAAAITVAFYLAVEKRRWLIPFVALILVAGTGAAMVNAGLYERLFQLIHYSLDHSNNTRMHLWQGHWAIFLDHPVFGVGLLEGDKFLAEYYARIDIVEEFYSHAHSNYIQWLSGTGAIGLLLYLYISWYFAKGAWDLRKRDSWGWGLLLAQIYFHLGGISEASFFDGEVNHMIVFVWAMTWARMNHFTVTSPVRKAK